MRYNTHAKHMSRQPRQFELHTRLATLPQANTVLSVNGETAAQIKKAARLEISVVNTSERLGFLHACLVKIEDRHYLLAGPSGVGKTTYAHHLIDELDAEILGNDWVAVEKIGSKFFVSDLNHPDEIKHREKCLLDGVIFLTEQDALQRDAFVPSQPELFELLRDSFDTATPEQQQKLVSFWMRNAAALKFLAALPTKKKREAATLRSLLLTLERDDRTTQKHSVGVIGLGSIGSALAYALGQSPLVGQVNLYNRTDSKATGYALDMNQAVSRKSGDIFKARQSAEDIFWESSIVFLAIRDTTPVPSNIEMPERWQKLPTHLRHVQEYAQIASETNFNGSIFVITNPVDILTYALYHYALAQPNALQTFQLYGVGLELDAARALFFAKNIYPMMGNRDILVYGNHADEYLIETPNHSLDLDKLTAQVRAASESIRQQVSRTVYGPVGAAMNNLTAFLTGQPAHITALQEGAFIGRKINFHNGLPSLPSTKVPDRYHEIVESNRQAIAQYLVHFD
jgi:malate/lactate dehydrogenase